MITRNNLKEIILGLDAKDRKRIINNTCKEYVIISLSVFNTGWIASIKLTNQYRELQDGSCILDANEVQSIIETETNQEEVVC